MSTTTQLQKNKIFETYSAPKALGAMVLPTIASQIIFVIYNMADTWFVGLRNDPNAVAAISLCLPVYNILAAISNLFGIGGAGVIARALGRKDSDDARNGFTMAIVGGLIVAATYSILMFSVGRSLLFLIGADGADIEYALIYVRYTIIWGGIPTILATTVGHLIRAYGYPRQASFGLILGAIFNVGLDPLFMFVLLPPGNEVAGAALATTVSNSLSLLFFIFLSCANEMSLWDLADFRINSNCGFLKN